MKDHEARNLKDKTSGTRKGQMYTKTHFKGRDEEGMNLGRFLQCKKGLTA